MKFIVIAVSLLSVVLIAPFLIPVRDLEGTVDPLLLADEDSMFVNIKNHIYPARILEINRRTDRIEE